MASDYWIRNSAPEYGNIYYNNTKPGISKCTAGRYGKNIGTKENPIWVGNSYCRTYVNKEGKTVKGAYDRSPGQSEAGRNCLPNCVGLAAGTFNETFVMNMRMYIPDFPDGWYYNLSCNGKAFKDRAIEINTTIEANGNKIPLIPILDSSAAPPLGGIGVYANGRNHVVYVTHVYNADSCHIIQSGYGGWKGPWDTNGKDMYRSTGWNDGDSGDAYHLIGWLANPAIDRNPEDPFWKRYAESTSNEVESVTPPPAQYIKLNSLTLGTNSVTLIEGNSSTVSVNYNPSNCSDDEKVITASSSDTTVAEVTVDSNGITIKALSYKDGGNAVITVTDKNKNTYTCNVDVDPHPDVVLKSVTITNTNLTVKAKDCIDLDFKVEGEHSSAEWSIDCDEKVASINEDTGVITTYHGGTLTATVVVTGVDADGNTITKETTVNVTVLPREGVYIYGKNNSRKFYVPYIYKNGSWYKVIAHVYNKGNWKKFIEKV